MPGRSGSRLAAIAWRHDSRSGPRSLRGDRAPRDDRVGSTWWAPESATWWTGCLFAAGSTCFALGAAPGYVDAVGVGADAVTFFVGSVFFTVAASLALAGAWSARPHADWWACVVQLVGTLFFNRSTFDAMIRNLSAAQANRLVWTPDALGSICFLVASGLAWNEIAHGFGPWQPRRLSWWIAGLNLLGSVAFGASAARVARRSVRPTRSATSRS